MDGSLIFTWDMLGASLILFAVAMVTYGRWQPKSYPALLTNVLGSVILGGVGIDRGIAGMILLNAVWIGVALVALYQRLLDDGVFDTREKLVAAKARHDLDYRERLRIAGLDKLE